jgi:hypothetical protein
VGFGCWGGGGAVRPSSGVGAWCDIEDIERSTENTRMGEWENGGGWLGKGFSPWNVLVLVVPCRCALTAPIRSSSPLGMVWSETRDANQTVTSHTPPLICTS